MRSPIFGLVLSLAVACGGNTTAPDSGPAGDAVLDETAADPGRDPGGLQDTADASLPDPGITADVPCVPGCTNRRCGDDGCGGSCGTCPYPDAHLECVDGKCLPPMIDIPAGTFWMGCNIDIDTNCVVNEKPSHDVTLSAFSIETYEVSAGAYKEYLAAMGPDCKNPGDGEPCGGEDCWGECAAGIPGMEAYPANGIGWFQADGYCRWAGRRLCTEAEWEYAARGDDGRIYPWGNDCPASWGGTCSEPEWSCETAKAVSPGTDCYFGWPGASRVRTSPIGQQAGGASPFGVMDMAGNVAEWVSDRYGSDYYCKGPDADTTWPFEGECDYGEPAFQSPWNEPTGPTGGEFFVLRGGDWWGTTSHRFVNLRTSDREFEMGGPGTATPVPGFRCCRSPQ